MSTYRCLLINIYLHTSINICRPVSIHVYLYICLSIHVYLYVYQYASINMYVHLSFNMSLSVYVYQYTSINKYTSIIKYESICIRLSIHVYPYVYQYVSPSKCLIHQHRHLRPLVTSSTILRCAYDPYLTICIHNYVPPLQELFLEITQVGWASGNTQISL